MPKCNQLYAFIKVCSRISIYSKQILVNKVFCFNLLDYVMRKSEITRTRTQKKKKKKKRERETKTGMTAKR